MSGGLPAAPRRRRHPAARLATLLALALLPTAPGLGALAHSPRKALVRLPLACLSVAAAAAGRLAPGVAAAQGVAERYDLGGRLPRELSLSEAVSIGLESNPDVRTARFRFDATRAGLWEAYGNFLPRLDLSAAIQKSGRGQFVLGGVPFSSPPTYTTYYQFDLTHRLFDAGRDIFRLQAAQAERRAADAQLGEDRLRTGAEIARQYVTALAARALVGQSEREIAARRTRRELAQARFDLGAVTRSDVLQARIGVTQAEVALATRTSDVREAELELLRNMGVEADPDSITLVERLEVFEPDFDPDSLVAAALAAHPRLERLRAIVEVRERDQWIARTAYLPTLEAGASFSSSVSDTSEFRFDDFQDRTTYSLSLAWELFGGFTRYDETSRAKAELRAAEEALRAGELAVAAAVRQAYLDLLTAHQTHQMREENVELARQELELAQERYRIGALSFPDLQDSQVTLTTAETDFIRASYDFFVALANLEEASGLPLFTASRPGAALTAGARPAAAASERP